MSGPSEGSGGGSKVSLTPEGAVGRSRSRGSSSGGRKSSTTRKKRRGGTPSNKPSDLKAPAPAPKKKTKKRRGGTPSNKPTT